MFLLDNLLLAPGKAVLFLLEEVAKKAQEEFLDDDSVRQELQEIYAMLDAGRISEQEFEAREHRLVERLQQIAMAKLQEHAAGMLSAGMSATAAALMTPGNPPDAVPVVIDAEPDRTWGAASGGADRPWESASAGLESTWGPPSAGPIIDLQPSPAAAPQPAPPPAVEAPAPRATTPVSPALSMAHVIDFATRGLAMLKLKVSAITSVVHDEGGWRVTAELVERRGVPDSSDLLGVYELRLDDAGNMLRYERIRMRRRCDLGR